MQLAPLICVDDVCASSRWYQRLLGACGGHGGNEYERLNDAEGRLVLQLHRWEVEHHHGPLGDPALAHGNGVLLWFELQDFDAAAARAESLGAEIIRPRQFSENGNWELWLRDPDGYAVVLTSPLP
ncbi:MAG: VOC family protein [Rubrivivax sp.]|nr:MAG: VOC family protein [Rubrivivax sp.]